MYYMVSQFFGKVYINKGNIVVEKYGNLRSDLALFMHFAVVFFWAMDIFGFEQSEHWVDDRVWITEVAVVVDGMSCLVFGLVLRSFDSVWCWYAAR